MQCRRSENESDGSVDGPSACGSDTFTAILSALTLLSRLSRRDGSLTSCFVVSGYILKV